MERPEKRMLRWIMGIKKIENIMNEEIRVRTSVANISEKIREARLVWFGEKDRRRCSNENMDDGSGWTPKDRKPETEVELCYKNRHEEETSKDRRSTSPEKVESDNAMHRPQISGKGRKEEEDGRTVCRDCIYRGHTPTKRTWS